MTKTYYLQIKMHNIKLYMRQSWRHLRSQKKFFELIQDSDADETEPKHKKDKKDKKDKGKDREARKAKADKEPENSQPSKKQKRSKQ